MEAEVSAGEIIEGVVVTVEGTGSDRWRVRILDQDGGFLEGVYLRYHRGGTTYTSNIGVGRDGLTKFDLNRAFDVIHFDYPGYESAEVAMEGRDASEIIEVRLPRIVE